MGAVIDRVLQAVWGGLAVAWRMCGSPRLWGDAWAWARLTGAYGGWRSVAGRWAAPAALGLAGLVTIGLIATIVVATGGGEAEPVATEEPTPTPGPRYMTEIEALPCAVEALRENGFEGESFTHIARRVPFGDYATAIGQRFQAEQGNMEVPVDREVWVFAFKGNVRLELPDQPSVFYDNLTIVLDALTGGVLRAEAFYGDFESPLRAPVWLRIPTPSPEPE